VNGSRLDGASLARSAVFLLIAVAAPAAAADIEVRLADGHVLALGAGLQPAWLSVFVDSDEDLPALTGECFSRSDGLIFQPKYPLQPGLRYRAELRLPGRDEPLLFRFQAPKPDRPPARVVSVSPSGQALPENLLRLYIEFSAPMAIGEAYRYVYLEDEQGRRLKRPFLEVEPELWDPDGRRLTILFDPGRVKRGLVPHLEDGAPLMEGFSYRLVIDSAYPDAEGDSLAAGYQREFVVGPADRASPEVDRWRVLEPAAGSRQPLIVEFGEPLDRALASRLIEIASLARKPLAGALALDRNETRLLFVPDGLWQSGQYLLAVDSVLEDLAGNSVGRPFEVNPAEGEIEPDIAAVVYRKFQVR
jgi:hypothetical protein